jgi:hypothetical protein
MASPFAYCSKIQSNLQSIVRPHLVRADLSKIFKGMVPDRGSG